MDDQPDWETAHIKSVAVLLNGAAIAEPDDRGEHIVDEFFVLFSAHYGRSISPWPIWTSVTAGA